MIEYWERLHIEGVEMPYNISSYGRIHNIRGFKELIPWLTPDGYKYVKICKAGKCVSKSLARLVMQTFKPEFSDTHQVNHINGDKLNNSLSNLEWVTCSENISHSYRIGIRDKRYGMESPTSKYTDDEVISVCVLLEKGMSNKQISKELNISDSYTVSKIRRGISWKEISKLYQFPLISHKRTRYSEKIIREICVLLEKGESNKTIREILFVKYSNTYKSLIEHIKTRKRYKGITQSYHW